MRIREMIKMRRTNSRINPDNSKVVDGKTFNELLIQTYRENSKIRQAKQAKLDLAKKAKAAKAKKF